jgi:hypothetical protein
MELSKTMGLIATPINRSRHGNKIEQAKTNTGISPLRRQEAPPPVEMT